jgi:hypothetical protein
VAAAAAGAGSGAGGGGCGNPVRPAVSPRPATAESQKRTSLVAGLDKSTGSIDSAELDGTENGRQQEEERRQPVKRACNECRQQKVSATSCDFCILTLLLRPSFPEPCLWHTNLLDIAASMRSCPGSFHHLLKMSQTQPLLQGSRELPASWQEISQCRNGTGDR